MKRGTLFVDKFAGNSIHPSSNLCIFMEFVRHETMHFAEFYDITNGCFSEMGQIRFMDDVDDGTIEVIAEPDD